MLIILSLLKMAAAGGLAKEKLRGLAPNGAGAFWMAYLLFAAGVAGVLLLKL
jgi:hypothetical protein